MRHYLDTSVALHAILPGGDSRARGWLDSGHDVYSSTLLGLELARLLRREGLDPTWAHAVLDRISQVSIDDGVLRVAASIEPHVRSLDAIHLATALMLGSDVALVTHDRGMATAAARLGFATEDPVG